MTSEIILHMSNIAKNIDSSPFPDPISGIYILQKPLLSNNLRTPPLCSQTGVGVHFFCTTNFGPCSWGFDLPSSITWHSSSSSSSKSKSRSSCSPTLTGNSHERTHGVPTYALRNRCVFRRRRNKVTDSCLPWSDAGSEFHAVGPGTAKLRGP